MEAGKNIRDKYFYCQNDRDFKDGTLNYKTEQLSRKSKLISEISCTYLVLKFLLLRFPFSQQQMLL